MIVAYLLVYVFFGWVLLEVFDRFTVDCRRVGRANNWGLFRRWLPEFVTLLLFCAYVFWCLYSLSSMKWGG